LTEVIYTVVERGYQGKPSALHSQVLATGLTIEPTIEDDAIRAAELIVTSRTAADRGRLSLGDGLCIAVAERLSLPVIGGDTHWETLILRTDYYPIR
jgi:ribonuclease VapC